MILNVYTDATPLYSNIIVVIALVNYCSTVIISIIIIITITKVGHPLPPSFNG